MARTMGRLVDEAAARWSDREALVFMLRERAVQLLGRG
jgi:hypothetical protein